MSRGRKSILLSWFTIILLGINMLAIIALLLSYLAPYLNPQSFAIPSLLGLFYPVLFVINTLFLLWWILRLKWLFLIPLLALLLGWNLFFKHFAFGSENSSAAGKTDFKVVSYNVRIFNVHNWRFGEEAEIRDSVISALRNIDADIVCLQEFFHGEQNYFPTVQSIIEGLSTPQVHTDFTLSHGKSKHYGLATFSKYPIINKGVIHFGEAKSNSGIFTDVLLNNDTIRIFNIHLESIKFSSSDHQFVSDFREPVVNSTTSSGKVIFAKLRNAFVQRASQAETVDSYIEASPYPVVLCGDFNDTPSSFAYHKVKGNLSDAFLKSGSGFGSTYADRIPFLRIDYIFHSNHLKSFSFQRHQVNYSDHYPISADFEIE